MINQHLQASGGRPTKGRSSQFNHGILYAVGGVSRLLLEELFDGPRAVEDDNRAPQDLEVEDITCGAEIVPGRVTQGRIEASLPYREDSSW